MADRLAEDMPPIPCPDCLSPTSYEHEVFICRDCGGVFSTPFGMDMEMSQRLWRTWRASPIQPGKWYREHTVQQLVDEHTARGIPVPVDAGDDRDALAESLNFDDRRREVLTHG